MFALLGLIFKLLFLALGIFFIMAGMNEWKWAMRLVLGKKTKNDMGDQMSKFVFIFIGAVLVILTVMWIF